MPHLPRPDVDTLEGLSASIVATPARMGADPRTRCRSTRPPGCAPDGDGTGRHASLDVDAVLDRTRSLNDGAITFPNFAAPAPAGKSSLLANLPRRDDLAVLDQRPIRGSRRSTPATYTGAMDAIRDQSPGAWAVDRRCGDRSRVKGEKPGPRPGGNRHRGGQPVHADPEAGVVGRGEGQ